MIENFKKIDSKELLLEELKNSNSTFDKGIISYNVKVMNYGYTFWDKDEKFLITVVSEKKTLFNTFESVEMKIYDLQNGFTVSNLYAEFRSKNKLYLNSIDTTYRYIRRGYGSLLIKLLIEYAREKNAIEIHGGMFLLGDLDSLKSFYKKNGFEVKSSSFKMNL